MFSSQLPSLGSLSKAALYSSRMAVAVTRSVAGDTTNKMLIFTCLSLIELITQPLVSPQASKKRVPGTVATRPLSATIPRTSQTPAIKPRAGTCLTSSSTWPASVARPSSPVLSSTKSLLTTLGRRRSFSAALTQETLIAADSRSCLNLVLPTTDTEPTTATRR